jgi:hypothetical protein
MRGNRIIGIILLGSAVLPMRDLCAQEQRRGLHLELKAGIVNSFLSANDYEDRGTGLGLCGGLGLIVPFLFPNISVQVVGLFVEKRTKFTSFDPLPELPPSIDDNYELGAEFIELPIIGRWDLMAGRDAVGYVMGGASVSWIVGNRLRYTQEDGSPYDQKVEDLVGWDWSPVVGGGFRFDPVLLEFRIGFGLNNLGGEREDTIDAKISTSYFLLGAHF